MELQSLTLLCGLGAAAFTACADRPRTLLFWGLCLSAMLLLSNPGLLLIEAPALLSFENAQAAILIALAAFARIQHPSADIPAVCFGGIVTAMWLSVMLGQGYPSSLALALALGIPLIAGLAALYRPGFRTDHLLEESLIIVLAAGVAVATVPAMVEGWRSAVALQRVNAGGQGGAGIEALLIAGAFIALGGMYAVWKQR